MASAAWTSPEEDSHRLSDQSATCQLARILSQEIGPIQAMISGQVRAYGNMAYILRNVGGTQRMVEVAATIPTRYPG
jgi:putative sterol carrier protein